MTAPVILVGPEVTTQNTANNPVGMDYAVYELEPSATPLTALMEAMGSRSAPNPKFEWLQDEGMPYLATLTASATSAATAFSVSTDIFRVGDVVRFSALGFGVLVTVTAASAISGTILGTAVSAASGAEVYLVGNANAELATMRELKFTQLTNDYNYDQIIRTPFGVSTTEMGMEHYGGPERDRLTKHFGIEHAKALEKTFWFGLRSINSVTRTAGGIQSYIATNITNDTSGMTEIEWQTALRTAFRYGSQEKVAFCSPTGVQQLEGYARSNIKSADFTNENTTYGVSMKRYISGQGTINIVMHRDWNDSAVYGGYIFIVDMNNVKARPLQNVGQTQLLRNRQAPDYDGVKDEYRSETGIQVIQERTHAVITGITGG
jgi:hypothetical protein